MCIRDRVKLDRTRFRAVAAAVIVLVTAGEIIWRNAGASLNAEPASRYAVFDGLSESQTRGLAVLAKELNDKAIAVSYTHLDVYKRQYQSRRRRPLVN